MKVLALGLGVLLAGCAAFPRGAGLQREILAQQSVETPTGTAQSFEVAPVTRARLAQYASWPTLGEPGLGWLERSQGSKARLIQIGDTLEVQLWTTEDNGLMSAPGQKQVVIPPLRVMADGSIFLPYVGSLKVQGMSERLAREKIQEAYEAVSPSAQVQIGLLPGRQSSVSLVAGVGAPGAYPLEDRDMTVLEVIARGGGVSPALKNPQVRLQRGGKSYGISLERLLASPGLDTTVQGGDRIFLEEDRRYFMALGNAGREAQVPFPRDRVTALDALALMGGLADARADARAILILRRYPAKAVKPGGPPHERTIFTLDLTSADGLFSAGEFRVMSGDLVYVTESPLGATNMVIGIIGSVFGLANSASATAARLD